MKARRVACALILMAATTVGWLATDWSRLPDADEAMRIARSVHILSERRAVPGQGTGRSLSEIHLLGYRFDYSIDTGSDNTSMHFRHAVIASEDHHFEKDGFGRIAYVPAKAADAAGTCVACKAESLTARCSDDSALSQQLARNLFLGERRSVHHKVFELLWALKMATELEKDKIPECDVDQVYFGNGNYGVDMAA